MDREWTGDRAGKIGVCKRKCTDSAPGKFHKKPQPLPDSHLTANDLKELSRHIVTSMKGVVQYLEDERKRPRA